MTTLSPDNRTVVKAPFHGEEISFESGWIAKQAHGSVIVRQGETVVMVTMCTADPRPGQNFFPMVVEYQEKFYGAGKIPGGFFKREGRPNGNEILTCRIIDRPIRPMFPDGYMDEVQIICTVMSVDGIHSPDVLALTGASAALHISHAPFSEPLAGVRVGRIDGKLCINPSPEELESADMNFIVAGTRDAIVMVEGGADFASEEDVLEALYFGHAELQKLIDMQEELRSKVGKDKIEFVAPETNEDLKARVTELVGDRLNDVSFIEIKHERYDAISALKKEIKEALAEDFPEMEGDISEIFGKLHKDLVRGRIVNESTRIDGRGLADVRPIVVETGWIPRAHGSSVFTRGETQAIVATTLGTSMDAQRLDNVQETREKTFMLHYNFPPYSVGEARMLRGTSRREVGHGALAERALSYTLPTGEDFPYVIRIVSEVTESNGSSSMASVCGGSMALMDAGVPIKEPVGGVAMGLIQEGNKFAVLTDILGDEDHLGDMDFKVCGSKKGISALQMDIKCDGLDRETMGKALEQAREGRLHIIEEMSKAISETRPELSKYAPVITTIKINPDKIRDVIGAGGKTIRSITETTGVKIDIGDDGTISIASSEKASADRAIEIIEGLTEEAEIGRVYAGVVKRVADFGAFVEILPGMEGLVHISQLANHRVEKTEDVVKEGDEVKVRVLDIDRQGRIRLSRKEALEDGEE